ncbi:hypothetical protein ACNPKZ_04255 [Shewanella algae]|uniref:hypothetical protein n=1 Tax=Shewanella algae TaxID=38313 RepID=UPI003AAD0310
MIELKQAIATEIGQFVAMEQLQSTSCFIMPYPAEKHLAEMTKDTVHYFSIYQNELNASRIWLDVFDINQVGRHIYQKLGYCEFDATEVNGKRLLFMQKWL